jgi:hypothetical protein
MRMPSLRAVAWVCSEDLTTHVEGCSRSVCRWRGGRLHTRDSCFGVQKLPDLMLLPAEHLAVHLEVYMTEFAADVLAGALHWSRP